MTARRLVGVGVGPGDPELVTVKAVRVLREADVVLVPVLAEHAPGRAEATVRAHLADDTRLRRVVFALDERAGVTPRRVDAWDAAAATVHAAYAGGAATVAFATIGDPNVYSTFGYLAQTVRAQDPTVVVATVPGVTAMQDLAARSGTVLCEGTESLALLPLTAGLPAYEAALRQFDTVVAYKGGANLPAVLDALDRAGRLGDAVYGAALGLPGEDLRPAAELDRRTAGPYLATVLAPPPRGRRGGRL